MSLYLSDKYNDPFAGTVIRKGELSDKISGFVEDLPSDGTACISLSGFPASGKSNTAYKLIEKIRAVLGGHAIPFFEYRDPSGNLIESGGFHCKNGTVSLLHLDYFFRALAEDRKGSLLASESDFVRLWSYAWRSRSLVWNILHSRHLNGKIYTGSLEEKHIKSPLGSSAYSSYLRPHGKKVFCLEGVDAYEKISRIPEEIRNRVSIHTLHILFNTSPEYSVLRTLRRDTRRKKDTTIESILSSRLLEHFYIEKYFIRPAFLHRDTVLLNPKSKVTPFSLQEKEEIHTSLVYLNELFGKMNTLSSDAKGYISGLCRDIETLLGTEAFPTVSDDDLIAWVHKKREKEQRKAEARRGGVN